MLARVRRLGLQRCGAVFAIALVHLLEAEQLVLDRRALGLGLFARGELAAIAVDRRLERREIRGGAGDLARIIRRGSRRKRLDLLRDTEQLIVVRRGEVSALDADVDQRLDLVRQVREVVVLEQDLVANRPL
jgi:hypothetical protein